MCDTNGTDIAAVDDSWQVVAAEGTTPVQVIQQQNYRASHA